MSASIVSGVDASPVLKLAEHVLDAVALTVECLVVEVLDAPVFERWDAGVDASLGERHGRHRCHTPCRQ